MKKHGFLADEQGDIVINDGDVVIGETTDQDFLRNLVSKPGDIRRVPQIGGRIQQLNKTTLKQFAQKHEPRIRASLASAGHSPERIESVIKQIARGING